MLKRQTNFHLIEKFEELESKRIALIKKLENYSLKQLNSHRIQNKWSIIQIIFHLIKTEHIVIISFKKAVKNNNYEKIAGLSAKIRSMLLNLALKTSIRFKAPKLMQNVPETYDFGELLRKWVMIRNELADFIKNCNSDVMNINIFRHPYAGYMNITQSIDFLDEHFNHHVKQIEKIRRVLIEKT